MLAALLPDGVVVDVVDAPETAPELSIAGVLELVLVAPPPTVDVASAVEVPSTVPESLNGGVLVLA